MVLLGAVALLLMVFGIAALASWAWGLRADRAAEPQRAGRAHWPWMLAVLALSVLATVVLRARGLPVLLLLLPFVFQLRRRRRRRCPACESPVSSDAEACSNCGTRLPS